MEYLYVIAVLLIAIYSLIGFKKKPGNSADNIYENSRFFRLVILIVLGVVALIISFFIKNN